jgi:DNA-binding response OmpR family regulator
MANTVLIVEDDPDTVKLVGLYLGRDGHKVLSARDGLTGLRLAREAKPDVIVLDIMLPRLDGMEICRTLREESSTPIIMLTARESHTDRIAGLDSGADDYVVKPFDPDEVVARAKAVLRRADDTVQQVLRCGTITIDDTTRQATVGDSPINLSQAQFALLSAFMRHPNQVLTREQLITLAFDDDFDAYDRAIDNHILRLRKQIGGDGKQPIQTVYGAGYRFVPEHS